jgi:L-amino acid N-acyltransferase YncA
MAAYAVRPIVEADILPSQLLIEGGQVGISADDWRIFVRRIIEWRGATGLHDEVYVALDPNGVIKGLVVSQAIQSLLFGRTLDAPIFLTASAADEDGVIMALLDALAERARMSGCTQTRIWSAGGEAWRRVAEKAERAVTFAGLCITVAA